MGSKDRGSRGNSRGVQHQESVSGPLTGRPFKDEFRGMKIGPECLVCKKVIDTRLASSRSNRHGARVTQRQGFIHDDCVTEVEKKYFLQEFKLNPITNRWDKYVKVNERLGVPELTEEEIVDVLASMGIQS